MKTVTIRVGKGEPMFMTWDPTQSAAPIKLDGQETGFQTADAKHSTKQAVRLVLRAPCAADGVSVDDVWDDVEYHATP